jgi:hypothetical protein
MNQPKTIMLLCIIFSSTVMLLEAFGVIEKGLSKWALLSSLLTGVVFIEVRAWFKRKK